MNENIIVVFAYKSSMAKVNVNGKWYKAGGCGYDKETALINQFLKNQKYKKYKLNDFKMNGWDFETVEICPISEISKEVA